MADPWARTTPTNWPNGANAGTDNFSGLANNTAKCLGVIQPGTLSAPLGDVIIPSFKITFTSAPTGGALFTRYLLFSEDNTTPVWPGNISPTSTSDQSALLAALIAYAPNWAAGAMIDQLVLSASVTTYYTPWYSVRGLFAGGNIPTFMTMLCYNQSGVALATYSASNQITPYVTETYN